MKKSEIVVGGKYTNSGGRVREVTKIREEIGLVGIETMVYFRYLSDNPNSALLKHGEISLTLKAFASWAKEKI